MQTDKPKWVGGAVDATDPNTTIEGIAGIIMVLGIGIMAGMLAMTVLQPDDVPEPITVRDLMHPVDLCEINTGEYMRCFEAVFGGGKWVSK